MNSSLPNAVLFFAACTLLCPMATLAVVDTPPVINTSSVSRSVSTLADWTFDGKSDVVESSDDSSANGPFVKRLQSEISHVQGAKSDGFALHESSISAFQIKGEAKCRSDATGPSTDPYVIEAANIAEFEATFTIPVDTTAAFSSRIEADTSGANPLTAYAVRIEFKGTRSDGTAFRFYTFRGSGISIGPDEFFEIVELKANAELIIKWRIVATAINFSPGNEFAEGNLVFELNLGDRDGDGLLDAWETDGIDIDFDGIPEINLPAMGANPDKKNLFVELDSQAGVPVDLQAIAMVEQAFAEAPASMVDNPDGSDGILLFVLVDDDDLVNEPWVSETWPVEFDQQKSAKYGTAALRAHPDWNEKIKPFYKLIFRYCIWANSLADQRGKIAGMGELPGDDFFIAVTPIFERYSGAHEHLRTKGLAGTFMHELGHNLNLHHGGQDDVNFKPNYLSVMNYGYAFPLRGVTVEGTPRSIAWELDFARTAPMTLNEQKLREDQGLDGPAGRRILFNAAAESFPALIQIADANAAEIDWNLSGPPIETDPVAVDITRLGGRDNSLDDALEAFTDWDKLWYHLSGSSAFGDGPHLSDDPPEPFYMEIFSALDAFEATDRSTPDDTSPNQNYNEWAIDTFPAGSSPADMDPLADPDQDGHSNLQEYYFGTNPNLPDDPPIDIHLDFPGNLRIQYRQSRNIASVEATLQISTDLNIWTDAEQAPTILSEQDTYNSLQASFPITSSALFFRIHLSITP